MPEETRRPNIIYLNSHDTGRYIQPYGFAVQTPHMQRLAEEGVLFRQHFCNAPTCSPSRAGLLTGTWAHVNGMLGLAHRGFGLHDYSQHLVTTLKNAGYHTAWGGMQHVSRWDKVQETIGYHEPIRGKTGPERAEATADWLRNRKPDDTPFYLEIGFVETHRTSGKEIQWHNGDESPLGDPRYTRPPLPLPDTPTTRQDFADYAECVRRLDSYYGTILDALTEAGHADNTLVVLTTDHGLAFPFMKCNLNDHGMGVLMIVRGPTGSAFRGGKVVDAMTQHLDVFPTICDAAGIEKPDWLRGKSMASLCDGSADAAKPDALHEEIFAEVTYHAAYEPKRAVRTSRYKYIRRYDDEMPGPILPNVDPSTTKNELLDHGWADRPPAKEQLYDLIFDPNEGGNLADDPDYAPILDEMRGRLDRWMRETNDPLLNGPVPVPPGGKMNRRRGRQPSDEPVEFPEGGKAP